MNSDIDLTSTTTNFQSAKRIDTFDASLTKVLAISTSIHILLFLVLWLSNNQSIEKQKKQSESIVQHVKLKQYPIEEKSQPTSKQAIKPEQKQKVSSKPKPKPKPKPKNEVKPSIAKKTPPPENRSAKEKSLTKNIPYIKELETSKSDKSNSVTTSTKKQEKILKTAQTEKTKSTGIHSSASKGETKGPVNYGKNKPKKEAPLSKEEKAHITKTVNAFLEKSFKRILALWVKPKDYIYPISGIIKIKLNEKGEIVDAYISRSSGDRDLDNSVLEAVNRTKRFAIPNDDKIPPRYFKNISLDYDSNM